MSEDTKILSTTDYDRFFSPNWQRQVSRSRVEGLKRSMLTKGEDFQRLFPIIAKETPDGRLMCTDGQHRLAAARDLGRPIYYVLVREHEISHEIIAETNSLQKAWSFRDYIQSFAARNKESYLWILKMGEKYMPLPLLMISLFADKDHPAIMQALRSGELSFSEPQKVVAEDFLEKFHQLVQELAVSNPALLKAFNQPRLFAAFWKIYNTPQYHHSLMMSKVEKVGNRFRLRVKAAENVQELLSIYNYRNRNYRLEID